MIHMKRTFSLFALLLACLLSGQMPAAAQLKPSVDVLYFHGKVRCKTCNAIEQQSLLTLRRHFAPQLKTGQVTWRVVDISKEENRQLAEQYKVSWSSLILVTRKAGKSTPQNLTQWAFTSVGDKQKYASGLRDRILRQLK